MCDTEQQDIAHAGRGYRRALTVVVALNLGMAVAELVAGVIGRSQSLKADALDFLGDGTITLIGLRAVSRGRRWRARAAYLQGIFLGLLALGVIGAAVYRAVAQKLPEAVVMTTFGLIALVINVACATILVPHRHGDANVQAVWLFSRNDALGNLAVAVAGALVRWTGSPWPDIITAMVIAALFLHSSVEILRNARTELREFTT